MNFYVHQQKSLEVMIDMGDVLQGYIILPFPSELVFKELAMLHK
jgi:hypothetical protein